MSYLETDVIQENFDDFGLKNALTNEMFFQEFSSFVNESTVSFHQFPLLYDFVKNKIWYIIVHQQQIEGLFNKWNLKTHPNMTNSTQQAKMRLSVAKVDEIQVTGEQLRIFEKKTE
ncbi:5001_t:CDS:2 [Ambispora leptoticha]|uniref:5001_t:CDS:1 n=1 Tax=Ambispora leptoticha TaxID=144679 RepID=A0A9N9GD23_9GLOM|nr:5001_t:CDS:2 [Ambispora leptoticha]